ncbi:hypothetical protein PVK06_001108 [Gossypium arboreum]|uniref:(+)-delta-cadinene synthase n=1 Tax=Gossypium arboreum TaxID=29729 RepID=A0ABR0R067_GOSAR|nr:hypothetical protein PVK06_001108 [Gossypium arboreum]
MGSTANPIENVKFIDTLIFLGVSYHIEDVIENQLETIFTSHHNRFSGNHHDLNSTSIVFRVFRQYGFKISCNVFNKFKDTDGKLKESFIDDVKGMLSLYEAAYLRVHEEDILEEALAFTTVHLKSLENKSNPNLVKQIANALDQPLNKCLPRLATRTYISFYEEEDYRIETLLKFARLDYNRVQGRIFLTKMILLVSILDDTFDAYGTPQELQHLIDVLKRKSGSNRRFKWLRKEPKSMKALDVIGRLMNDIMSHKGGILLKVGQHVAPGAAKKQAMQPEPCRSY